ncbi:MAG: transposase [Prevotella sp.]|nr:transposase [Prevotella sp.]
MHADSPVFAVARREALIGDAWIGEFHAYLAGVCRNLQYFVHAIGGTGDHVHPLVKRPLRGWLATVV